MQRKNSSLSTDKYNLLVSSTGIIKKIILKGPLKGEERDCKLIDARVNCRGLKYKQIHFLGKKYLVHRLVAEAYLGLDLSNTNSVVCHKDDNPSNNSVTNLFVGSQKQNMSDKYRMKVSLSQIKKIRQLIAEGFSDENIFDTLYSI